MQQWLVAHVQRAHELQCRDLQREVERRDDGDGAIGPAQPVAGLAHVIPRVAEATCEKAYLVASKVLLSTRIQSMRDAGVNVECCGVEC